MKQFSSFEMSHSEDEIGTANDTSDEEMSNSSESEEEEVTAIFYVLLTSSHQKLEFPPEIDSDQDQLDEETDSTSLSNTTNPTKRPWMHIVWKNSTPAPDSQIHLSPTAEPVHYVNLFLTEKIVNLMVTETNRYSDQWISSHQKYLRDKPRSRVHQWIKYGKTTREEMKAFISVIINMELIKKSSIKDYWDVTYSSQSTPWFVTHFNRDRFQLLNKFLHYTNNEELPDQAHSYSKLLKVKKIVDIMKQTFMKYYAPFQSQRIACEDSTVSYQDKTPTPNKQNVRYGSIELSCFCDSVTHYTHSFEISANSNKKRVRRPQRVVKSSKSTKGVNNSEAPRLYAYLSEKKTLKWTHKLVFSLLGRSLLNAYILYTQHTSNRPKLDRHTFTVQVVESLMGAYEPSKIPRKRRLKTSIDAARVETEQSESEQDHRSASICNLEKIGEGRRRRCVFKHPVPKKSVWQCSRCEVTLCPTCFAPYHRSTQLM